MLRVLTINNKIEFHAVAFDIHDSTHQTCLMDLTEHLQLRLIPPMLRSTIRFRFFVRADLVKGSDDLWRISRQIDNLPSGKIDSLLLPGLIFADGGMAIT